MPVDEWDRRVLCPDDGCIGVIGPGGTCKVCGRAAPNWGDERNRGLTPLPPEALVADDADDAVDDADSTDDDAIGADLPAVPDLEAEAPEWQERRLCVDDACIGLISPEGLCKVCGKPAAGTDDDDDDATDATDAKAADADA